MASTYATPGAYVHSSIGRRAFRYLRSFCCASLLAASLAGSRRALRPATFTDSRRELLPLHFYAGAGRPRDRPGRRLLLGAEFSSSSRLCGKFGDAADPCSRGNRRRRRRRSALIYQTPRARRRRTGASSVSWTAPLLSNLTISIFWPSGFGFAGDLGFLADGLGGLVFVGAALLGRWQPAAFGGPVAGRRDGARRRFGLGPLRVGAGGPRAAARARRPSISSRRASRRPRRSRWRRAWPWLSLLL